MTIDEKLKIIARGIQMVLVGTGPLTFEYMIRQGGDVKALMDTYDKIIKELEEVAEDESSRIIQ